MDEKAIDRALTDLRVQSHENHAREVALAREVARRLKQSSSEIISAVEHAKHVYQQGRNEIADKLIQLSQKVRHIPAPRGMDLIDAEPSDRMGLRHETGDSLKLY